MFCGGAFMIENNGLITARNLADELNLSIETIWRYTREERIPYIVLGNKRYRYRLADVMEALSTSYVAQKPFGKEASQPKTSG